MSISKTNFVFLILLIAFNGCITLNTVDKIKKDRRHEEVVSVESAFFDNNTNLIINFTGKSPRVDTIYHYYFILNTDSLFQIINRYGEPEPVKKRFLYLDSAFTIHPDYHKIQWDLFWDFIKVDLKRTALKKGDYFSDAANINDSVTVINNSEKLFEYGAYWSFSFNTPDLTARHFTFAFKHHYDGIYRYQYECDSIIINIEPSGEKRYNRCFYLPLSFLGDIVTSPFQLIGLLGAGCLALPIY
ncbi:MAG: hypothetical protein A2W91_07595 [Bacteroidetes bacterium GWF2_38_335]|nr:MAG: hypothetical protein A2W91_07595 [Bacteroidetes bacterium GWF2_38_335]OFY79076.1 MAG: hypothetical protein A2281_03125 [Bacteroidetes bacterium RIFOXYA12_FULL_38_20]HBS86163.1 hypothetical protein [Bacteroidales bacterium]